jgi:hypothetical protein
MAPYFDGSSVALLLKIIQLMEEDHRFVTLVVPIFTTDHFFISFQDTANEDAIPLPVGPNSFFSGVSWSCVRSSTNLFPVILATVSFRIMLIIEVMLCNSEGLS